MGTPNGINPNNVLAHYGVIGMKWGKRQGSSSSRSPKPVSDDAKNASETKAKIKKSGVSSLSNKEIQEYVTRKSLEQQYSKLNPSKIAVGRTIAFGILGNVGKQIASEMLKKALTSGINNAVKKGSS